jgi:hypothetical protein
MQRTADVVGGAGVRDDDAPIPRLCSTSRTSGDCSRCSRPTDERPNARWSSATPGSANPRPHSLGHERASALLDPGANKATVARLDPILAASDRNLRATGTKKGVPAVTRTP